MISIKIAVCIINIAHLLTFVFGVPLWYKPFCWAQWIDQTENTQGSRPSWAFMSSRKHRSKKCDVCVAKPTSPEPISKNKRLIREGSMKEMALEGELERLVVELLMGFLVASFRVSRKRKTNVVPWQGTWHAWETGSVQFKLEQINMP